MTVVQIPQITNIYCRIISILITVLDIFHFLARLSLLDTQDFGFWGAILYDCYFVNTDQTSLSYYGKTSSGHVSVKK